jgi:aminoglycoside 2''-phosphotransferase
MSEIEIYVESIHEAYPDFVIEKVHSQNQEGQFNDILVINDEFIFRFPRYSEGVAGLIAEIQLLKFIHGYVSLPIPNPVYSKIKAEVASKVFMGYRIIPGEPLWREKLAAITDNQTLQRLANQLASFLKELHNIPINSVTENLPVQDGPDEWAKMYADIQHNLYHFMRSDAQAWASDHFETYLNKPQLHKFKACLRHGDFGPSNILYDHEAQVISGIIDFGAIGLGDPAIDIAAASSYGELFFKRFYTAYPEIKSMQERAQFYKGTYALQEALHGFKNNDREAFESGIAEYV